MTVNRRSFLKTSQILLESLRFKTADDAREYYHGHVKHWPWASVADMAAHVEPLVASAMEKGGMPFEVVSYEV